MIKFVAFILTGCTVYTLAWQESLTRRRRNEVTRLYYTSSSPLFERMDRKKLIQSSILPLVSLLPIKTANSKESISSLLETKNIQKPPPSRASEFNGVDNMYFPTWMEGEWQLTQTLVNTETPLGLKFIGGPSGSEQIGRESQKEQEKQKNLPVELRVRFLKTKFGVAEDRLYNLRNRLDAFAGRPVVSSVIYADVGESNRQSVLAMGGSESDPLQTTLVYFKGPAAQKTFMVAHESEFLSPDQWAGLELDRAIFALTNQSTAPPVTTDTALIWLLTNKSDGRVEGRLRLAEFLNPQDALYFEARNRAVSIADYSLTFRKVQE